MPSKIEQAVLAAIDDERIVEDLERLVRIPSVDGTAAASARCRRGAPNASASWS